MESDLILKDNGTVAVTGDCLKADVTDLQMFYQGGHVVANDGNLELGSTDNGTLKGFAQDKDGTVKVQGDRIAVTASASVEITACDLVCRTRTLSVRNPNIQTADSQHRVALMQGAADELVLNAAAHYKGGVRIEGNLDIRNEVVAQGDFIVATSGKLLLAQPDLTPAAQQQAPTGLGANTGLPHIPAIPVPPLDVLQTIKALQVKVRDLTARLEAVEHKVGP